jgi:hypothetical protein
MRVKFLIALAIASVLLFCSMGIAAATTISGVPTAEQLTAAANNDINCFGFPDLGTVEAINADVGLVGEVDEVALDSPICGVCGEIPPRDCVEKTTVIPGPKVNLGCPLVIVDTVPVNLVSPIIKPVFPAINLAPQAKVTLPEVTTTLNCFDIACQPCTSINECPTVKPTARPTAKAR